MIVGEFAITDGTTYIDLIHGAFRLVEWTPAVAQDKDGGVWNDNMLTDGRRPVMFKRGNAEETFQLRVVTSTQDDTILETQELRRLLEKAKSYWTSNWQNAPVWIVARGSCETNKRYAYIFNYIAERDDDPYQSPFYGEALATMDEFSLVLERSDWLSNPPGEGACVAVASREAYWSGGDVDTSSPTQSDDDCEIVLDSSTIDTAAQHTHIGDDATHIYCSGIRFRNVAVPAGATITYARIDVVASDNDSAQPAFWMVFGQRSAAPAVFSTFANFMARVHTTNYFWGSDYKGWTAGNTYVLMDNTSDSRALIQEIVNLGGWAAGNNLAVIIWYGGVKGYRRYASFNDALQEPILYLEWSTGETAQKGRSATCANEVYFANKHNKAQITHFYYYDASVPGYSGNLIGTALPYYLFPNPGDAPPAVPAVNDIAYWGIQTSLLDSGPFASIILDIGTAGADILGMNWEYWTGAAWAALTINAAQITDGITGFFSLTGVRSVSFDIPNDWAANDPGMGITGYWVRAIITGIGAAPAAPTQTGRDFYTVVRPNVDLAAAQVPGDISALARAYVYDWGGVIQGDSVLLATRSGDRGTDFRMYLNLADEQNPANIDAAIGVNTSFAAYPEAPAGRCILYNPGAGSTGDCKVTIDTSIARDFLGQYRVYLRVDRESAVTDCTVKLKVGLQGSTPATVSYFYESETLTVASNQEAYLIDFGIVNIPGVGIVRDDDEIMPIVFTLELANTTATPNVYLYDLILLPVDEWSGEFNATDFSTTNANSIGIVGLEDYKYLDIDSLDLKGKLLAHLRYSENDEVVYSWQDIVTDSIQLQANENQMVYGMIRRYNTADDIWYAPVEGIGTIQLFQSSRYLSMRGAR